MASKRIDVNINSTNAGTGFKSASQDVNKLKTQANQASSSISKSMGTSGTAIGQAISKGSTVASNALSKLSTVAGNAASRVKTSFSQAASGADSLSSAISGVASGYGLMQLAQDAWIGSTQAEFNKAYLATKMSTSAASSYLKTIQQVVAEVPGDDTYMNSLITGAVARQTNLTTSEIKALGTAAADYMTVSNAMGKSQIETQMDLKEYIQTGNTSQLERDSILKNQMSTLENQATVSDRILALNQALTAEGYAGLSQLDIASIKAEELKGKFQLALTTIGNQILPTISNFIGLLIDLDTATGGWSTTIGVVTLAVVLLGTAFVGAIGVIGPALVTGIGLITSLGVVTGITTVATYAWTAAQWLLNAALTANPIGLVIVGIAALIGVIYALTTDLGGCRTAIVGWGQDLYNSNSTVKWLVDGIKWLVSGIQSLYNTLSGGQGGLAGFFNFLMNINPQIRLMVTLLRLIAPVITGVIIPGLANLASQGSSTFSTIYKWAMRAYNYIRAGVSGIIRVPLNALSAAYSFGVRVYNYIRAGVSGAIRIATGAISTAYNMVTSLYNKVKGGVTGVINMVTGKGPAMGSARGPGGKFDDMSFRYENYAGHQKNPFTNGGMSGNCVDMSLGLMALNGGRGKIVQGTWNGGPHVWYQDPSGKNYDPARKALNGTWNPPARGPGDGYNNTYVFNAPVYDWDKFQKDVAKANDRIVMGGI